MNRLLPCLLLVLAPLAPAAQVSPPAPGPKSAEEAKTGQGAKAIEELKQGRAIFLAHCMGCHGPNGEGGRGAVLAQPNLTRVLDQVGDAAGSAAYDRALQQIITRGIPGTEMPANKLRGNDNKLVAMYVKSLGRRPVEKVPGDPAEGERLVRNKGGCLRCHTLHGEGGAIGPNLTQIGRSRSAAYLRRALTDPGAEVPQSSQAFRSEVSLPNNFLFLSVKTKSGEEVAGVRVNEDTFSLQIRDMAGKVHSFFKSDLAEVQEDWGLSPMPPFTGVFTPAEMDDVVAFLVSLTGSHKHHGAVPPAIPVPQETHE